MATTRQLQSVRGLDGNMIAFLDDPELSGHRRTGELLDAAESMMRNGSGAARSDECTLFKALHACARALQRSKSQAGYARRSKAALFELHQRILQYLVSENIGLVYDMRRRARITDVDPDDLFSEGLWRLFQAVRRFDPWRGFRFSTYACTSILRGFVSLRRKKRCETETLDRLRQRNPVQEDTASSDLEVESQWLKEQVLGVVMDDDVGLSPIERFVVARRLLNPPNDPPDTLQSVGALFSLSKERIRQIQLAALDKLRGAIADDEHAADDRHAASTEAGTKWAA